MRARSFIAAILFAAACNVDAFPMQLTLSECIQMARKQSVEAAVSLGQLKAAYWQYRAYRADLLPEVSFDATLPSYNKQYNAYMREDGSYSYVPSDNMGMAGRISLTQKIWPTGGTLSVTTSLDYMRQMSGSNVFNKEQFMSLPIALTLNQPIFGVNYTKWNRRIEPLHYREAKADFLINSEHTAMMAISKFFNLVLARERVATAKLNLSNAEKLYDVAKAKRQMGQISENDVLQMRLTMLNAKSSLTSCESEVRSSLFALQSFLGIEEDIELVLPDEIPDVTLIYQDVLDKALANNSFAINLRRRQIEADYNVACAKGERRNISLFAQVGFTATDGKLKGAYDDLHSNQVLQVGISVPLLDWGKRKGRVKVAESNREVAQSRMRQESQDFTHDIFVLTEQFNNQHEQLIIAIEADTIAQRRYTTNVETFKIGTISTLELGDAQTAKDNARIMCLNELYRYWYYYYQIRSLTLWDFAENHGIDTDFENLLK
ncbi:MAG: TolC family protein [Bacteroidales bacterium]|nr:TolC family protein [Bacteroidales bacterium]